MGRSQQDILKWYGQWLKVYPKHHLEEVPFSKILMGVGWLNAVGKEEGYVPHPHSSEEPPRLRKHSDGFYTVVDGRRRLFESFFDQSDEFGNRGFHISELSRVCLVEDNLDPKPSRGKFVWQIGALHGNSYREIKTPKFIRLWRWISGKSRFYLLHGKLRRKLSISTQGVLSEVEDALATLYSDGLVRVYDLQQLMKLIEESKERKNKNEVFISSQLKRLKKYEKVLIRLVQKDKTLESKEGGLLEKLSQAIARELQKSNLTEDYTRKLGKLQEILQDDEAGIQAILLPQLEIIQKGEIPLPSEIEKVIAAEQKFLKEIVYWTH